MKKLTAAGGVLFKEREDADEQEAEVLLIFRRGVWDLPKGKLEPGESIRECARREVSEEIGSSLPKILARLGDTYHEYRENDQLIGKTTHWFVMALTDDKESLKPEEKEGIEELQWVSASRAKQQVGYDNLVKVLKDFQKWYSSNDKL